MFSTGRALVASVYSMEENLSFQVFLPKKLSAGLRNTQEIRQFLREAGAFRIHSFSAQHSPDIEFYPHHMLDGGGRVREDDDDDDDDGYGELISSKQLLEVGG